ncbi:UNVERIFIED_CONTAM: Ceramide synthase 3 [Siphonaria sp. JEL0065]|nr:Ceramide synthase 3 [Siphonaria sp. JEL0065]
MGSFVLPPYVDLPTDYFIVIAWTAAWGVAHTLMYSLVITPLAHVWFVLPKKAADQAAAAHPATPTKASPAKKRKNKKSPSKKAEETASFIQPEAPVVDEARAVNNLRKKFSNAFWKCFVYSVSALIGIYVLSEDWWWLEPKEWMLDYPDPTSWRMKTYYYVGFGNYLYQTLTLMSHPKQSDFLAVCIHHISTVLVMVASYAFGFTRIGVIILLLHDFSDPFMEFAKCNLYLKRQKVADNFFTMFAVVFLSTRNVLFPYVILSAHEHSILEDGSRMPRGFSFWGDFCLGCLWVLAALNVYWGYLIVKIAVKTIITGEVEGDIREEDDE